MRAIIGVVLALACPVPVAAAPLGATPLEPGLTGRKDIIFFESFESSTWYSNWKITSLPKNCSRTSAGFKGKALKVAVPKGQHYGTSFGFNFAKFALAEPESLYFRYYLRFDSSWDGGSGGKLPGFGGTYGVAGWGGKPAHGDDGWSARGNFKGGGTGKTWIGYYVYHADMTGTYDNTWLWQINNLGLLNNNKWYCVEGYVKLDSPAGSDGILRGWVDGKLAYEKTGLNFRTVSKLKIERFWFDIYYGGSWTPVTRLPNPTQGHPRPTRARRRTALARRTLARRTLDNTKPPAARMPPRWPKRGATPARRPTALAPRTAAAARWGAPRSGWRARCCWCCSWFCCSP